VAVCIDPESRPVVQQEMVEDERLYDRNAAAAFYIQQRDTVVE
jgi:hypothetical protein